MKSFASNFVRPKKHLGQHFLNDLSIAADIVDAVSFHNGYTQLLEIGPGTGVLTDFLLKKNDPDHFSVVEIDVESIVFLKKKYPNLSIIEGDFLKMKLEDIFSDTFGIIGNFPYNISSQIFFKVLDYKDHVQEVVCMLQKEVAERLCAGPGGRDYGILSVFLQAYYHMEYLFTVDEHVFSPPPKVKSGVIRAKRNQLAKLPCNEILFRKVVKQAFSTRRKTLRNCLKIMQLPLEFISDPFFNKRAEELGVDEYVWLTNQVEGFKNQK